MNSALEHNRKASGIPGLGNVPDSWKTVAFRHLLEFENGQVDPRIEPYASATLIAPNHIESGTGRLLETESARDQGAISGKYQVRSGDIVYSKIRPALRKVTVSTENCLCSADMYALRPFGKGSSRFFLWSLLSDYFSKTVILESDRVAMPKVNRESLGAVRLLCPPLSEQTQIARFLDYETAKIDRLIGKQQQLIALLKEKRQAVISHAVTTGLNPDAPMKDSGVEWLGEVPAHWGAGPLKRFWEVIDCKHVTVPFFDEGLPVASVMEVREFDLDLSRVLRTSQEFFNLLVDGGRRPRRGDVIYCRNTANTGTSAYVNTDEPIAIGQDVVLIKAGKYNGRFLNYILHGHEMAAQLETQLVGSTFKRINVADIRALVVTCPPKAEQDNIVSYIDERAARFDALISNSDAMASRLQERRTALISGAVTGKIDVRGWKPPKGTDDEQEVA